MNGILKILQKERIKKRIGKYCRGCKDTYYNDQDIKNIIKKIKCLWCSQKHDVFDK